LFILSVAFAWIAASADAQVFKKIDPSKISDFNDKQFGTKSWSTKEYGTKEYDNRKSYLTKGYTTHEYNYSSKSFDTKMAEFRPRGVKMPEVETKSYDKRDKEFSTKSYATKDVETPGSVSRIADKPVTDWRTLIRKTPPSGLPGKPNDIPFSQWKAVSETK
jgi:hypothetical protein